LSAAGPDFFVRREAVFSDCRRYRYRLSMMRQAGPRVLWVLLNPSVADEFIDDPTVRRCQRWAAAWGYAGAEIVNIFAWRDTDPKGMRAASDPVGPDNDRHLLAAAADASLIVCGWGVHGAHMERGRQVAAMLHAAGHTLNALRVTRGGHPQHPLYLPSALAPSEWPGGRLLQATKSRRTGAAKP
jgi:hypothetical protein